MKKLMKNNKGMTLLELIVVLGISGVIMGIASFSLAMQPSSEAKKTVMSIDAMMTRTKTSSLAKEGDIYMQIYMDGVKVVLNYYENGKLYDSEVLAERKVEVHYAVTNGDRGTAETLRAGESLILSFNRRTTGFLTLKDAWTLAAGNGTVVLNSTNAHDEAAFCTNIWVSGGTVEYFIDLGAATGTHYPSIV